MSTKGIAHHQRGTFPMIDTDAEHTARKARYAPRDAAYRAALRLGGDGPLPKSLGQTVHNGGARTGEVLPSGGRMRRQVPTI